MNLANTDSLTDTSSLTPSSGPSHTVRVDSEEPWGIEYEKRNSIEETEQIVSPNGLKMKKTGGSWNLWEDLCNENEAYLMKEAVKRNPWTDRDCTPKINDELFRKKRAIWRSHTGEALARRLIVKFPTPTKSGRDCTNDEKS
eukprot:gb/GEZJ01004752.1/.p1 GENE.gb/GEZJ01004752.1/~~gb/GEZJ01004752.1/.p1  ORF type:complete len:142 (-),score=14.90 gb/GEZJ01004752.1/:432-857(-)